LTNIVLKDGLLTIDMENNTLFQLEVDTDHNYPDEKGFNEFCNQLLKPL
jgi:hypothetical protein